MVSRHLSKGTSSSPDKDEFLLLWLSLSVVVVVVVVVVVEELVWGIVLSVGSVSVMGRGSVEVMYIKDVLLIKE